MRGSEKRLLVLLAFILVPLAILAVRVSLTSATTDFFCFWHGSAFVLEGRDPYDETAWTSATSGVSLDAFDRMRRHNCYIHFLYPLTTGVALAPLATLPVGLATAIWETTIFVAAGAGVVLLAKSANLARYDALALAVLVALSLPFEQTVLSAQFGGLALLAAGLLAPARLGAWRTAAGIVLAALKPHVLPLAMLARLRMMALRTVALAVVPAVGLAAVSLVLYPSWPIRWAGGLSGERNDLFAVSVSIWTLGAATAAPLLPFVIVVVALVPLGIAVLRTRPLDSLDQMAIAAVVWQIVVPYGLVGDQLASLALCWTTIYRRTVATGSLAGTAALLFVAALLPWILFATRLDVLSYAGLELSSTLVPPATAIVLAAALLTLDAAGSRERAPELAR